VTGPQSSDAVTLNTGTPTVNRNEPTATTGSSPRPPPGYIPISQNVTVTQGNPTPLTGTTIRPPVVELREAPISNFRPDTSPHIVSAPIRVVEEPVREIVREPIIRVESQPVVTRPIEFVEPVRVAEPVRIIEEPVRVVEAPHIVEPI